MALQFPVLPGFIQPKPPEKVDTSALMQGLQMGQQRRQFDEQMALREKQLQLQTELKKADFQAKQAQLSNESADLMATQRAISEIGHDPLKFQDWLVTNPALTPKGQNMRNGLVLAISRTNASREEVANLARIDKDLAVIGAEYPSRAAAIRDMQKGGARTSELLKAVDEAKYDLNVSGDKETISLSPLGLLQRDRERAVGKFGEDSEQVKQFDV